jgi:uridine kinase
VNGHGSRFPVENLLANYLNHRRDAHARHVEPARDRCDLIVNAELPPDLLATRIWRRIDLRALAAVADT